MPENVSATLRELNMVDREKFDSDYSISRLNRIKVCPCVQSSGHLTVELHSRGNESASNNNVSERSILDLIFIMLFS